MTAQDRQANGLAPVVMRIARLNADIQAAKFEINEIADDAYNNDLVRAASVSMARKVVKQLAKESAWDQVQREEQRQLEEAIDECRAALGMLADLPLGQAVQTSVASRPNGRANGGGEPEKRGRGRPKGARNKPKPRADDWARPAAHADELPPDIPE